MAEIIFIFIILITAAAYLTGYVIKLFRCKGCTGCGCGYQKSGFCTHKEAKFL